MRRRLFVLPGLSIVAAGIWLLLRNRAQNGVCSATFATTSSSALNRVCASVVLSYFESFAVISSGFIVTVFAMMMMNRGNKRYKKVARGAIVAVPRSWGAPPSLHR